MKRKIKLVLSILLIITLAIFAMFILGGCGDNENNEHTHDFSVKKTEDIYLKSAADCKATVLPRKLQSSVSTAQIAVRAVRRQVLPRRKCTPSPESLDL